MIDRPRRLPSLVLALGLALASGSRADGIKRGLSTKSCFLVSDSSADIASPEDRDRLRAVVNRRVIQFANNFVKSLEVGTFQAELEKIVEIGGGAGSRDKLLQFLGTLEPIDGVEEITGALPPAKKAQLKRIQLGWTLVSLVRYGAPGFKDSFDLGGDPGGLEDFAAKAEGDRAFLERIKAFEDNYERFVDVGREGQPSTVPDDDAVVDSFYQAFKQIFASPIIAPGTAPSDGLLMALAQTIVAKYLTRADQVWKVSPGWQAFSGTRPPVVALTNGTFIASGPQLLAWSLPRMDMDDPDAARDEIGKAYKFSFKYSGWVIPCGAGTTVSGSWGNPTADGITFSTDPAQFSALTGPGECWVFETLGVNAEAEDMEIRDRSMVVSGLDPDPDKIFVEDLVKSYWKMLDAYDQSAENLGDVGTSVTADNGGGDGDPLGRFGGSASGGAFP